MSGLYYLLNPVAFHQQIEASRFKEWRIGSEIVEMHWIDYDGKFEFAFMPYKPESLWDKNIARYNKGACV